MPDKRHKMKSTKAGIFAVHRYFTCLFLCFIGVAASGQIPASLFNAVTGEEFDTRMFSVKPTPTDQRLGVYHFGDSESEWDLCILKNDHQYIVQLWSAFWGVDQRTKEETFLSQCQTFNTVAINGNQITFGPFNGLLVDYNAIPRGALLLFRDFYEERNFGKDSADVGFLKEKAGLAEFYRQGENDFWQLSIMVQPDEFFHLKSASALRIMRNAIYARYGLLFQKGGEMDRYFSKQSWYRPYKKDVSHCLTDIEKQNIQKIIKAETKVPTL